MTEQLKIEVSIAPTPNPATMMFQFSQSLLDQGHDFPNAQEAERSPLAAKIFGFPWAASVYLGPDFVSVTKQDWVDWEILAEPLAGLIREHLAANLPLLILESDTSSTDEDPSDSDIVRRIKRALARDVRPVVAMDGGDVAFAKFEEGKLFLHMKGSCAGCPSKSVTLKQGIETRMRELFPEILEVVSL